ncbi:Ulp1 protease family, carboxy-terminal domain protein [Sesbania bispinosa]|nr:Ulp1 protease family, carboxy-terminal domain protein [Sesbania bispinosa]
MAKLSSTPAYNPTPKHESHNLNEPSSVRSLFSDTKEGSSSGYFINYQPLHAQNMMEEQQDSLFQSSWAPMLFNPPPGMILDEIDASVIAYIYRANKDNIVDGREILIQLGKDQANRAILKSLMPRRLVDQEQYALSWCTPPVTIIGYYKD